RHRAEGRRVPPAEQGHRRAHPLPAGDRHQRRRGAVRGHRQGLRAHDGRYVVVTPEELEAVEPGRSRTIDIEDFVDLDELDPVHFEKSYYLAPAGKEA